MTTLCGLGAAWRTFEVPALAATQGQSAPLVIISFFGTGQCTNPRLSMHTRQAVIRLLTVTSPSPGHSKPIPIPPVQNPTVVKIYSRKPRQTRRKCPSSDQWRMRLATSGNDSAYDNNSQRAPEADWRNMGLGRYMTSNMAAEGGIPWPAFGLLLKFENPGGLVS